MNELDIYNAADLMVVEEDLLDEYLLVDSFDSIRLAFDSEKVFPARLNRFVKLPSGSRYLVCYYLKNSDGDPIFCDYENHLLIDSEEGTSVVSLLKSNESNEIGVLNLQPSAVASFREAHASGRPVEDWMADLAAMPEGRSYQYWVEKDGDRVCMVRDKGVFFGHFTMTKVAIHNMDCYAPMSMIMLPVLLRPTFLEPYAELVNCLRGELPMGELFRQEETEAQRGRRHRIQTLVMEFVKPAQPYLVKGLPFGWEQMWKRILAEPVVQKALANTLRTEEKDFNHPLVGNIIAMMRNKMVLKDYSATDLAKAMGYTERQSMRGALGSQPSNMAVRDAVNRILTELKDAGK